MNQTELARQAYAEQNTRDSASIIYKCQDIEHMFMDKLKNADTKTKNKLADAIGLRIKNLGEIKR